MKEKKLYNILQFELFAQLFFIFCAIYSSFFPDPDAVGYFNIFLLFSFPCFTMNLCAVSQKLFFLLPTYMFMSQVSLQS